MSKLYNSVSATVPVFVIPDLLQDPYTNLDWVNFGADNNLPIYMANLVEVSPTHAAILDSKKSFIRGDVTIEGNVSHLDMEDLDGKGSDIDDFIEDLSEDLSTYETLYVEVVFNKSRTRAVRLNILPYENVRVGKMNSKGNVETFYVSANWGKKYIKKNVPKALKAFNPNNVTSDSAVIMLKERKSGQPYYTIPSYMSAIQWILMEDDIAAFNRGNIVNGFFPSMILNFFDGDPTDDLKEDMEKYINSKFSGTRGSKLMMFFNNDKEKKVTVDTFQPADLPKYFQTMIPEVKYKILTSHKSNPSLVGVLTETGAIGKADELVVAHQLYLRTTISTLQKRIIKLFKMVFRFNGDTKTRLFFENVLLDKELLIDTVGANDVNEVADRPHNRLEAIEKHVQTPNNPDVGDSTYRDNDTKVIKEPTTKKGDDDK